MLSPRSDSTFLTAEKNRREGVRSLALVLRLNRPELRDYRWSSTTRAGHRAKIPFLWAL